MSNSPGLYGGRFTPIQETMPNVNTVQSPKPTFGSQPQTNRRDPYGLGDYFKIASNVGRNGRIVS